MSEYIAMAQVDQDVAGVFETRAVNSLPWWEPASGSSRTSVRNMYQALENPAVWNAVKLISSDTAKLPCNIVRRVGEVSSTIDEAHPAQQLIRWQSNTGAEMAWLPQSAFQFWQKMMVDFLLWNNAYAWIDRDGRGRPIALYPLQPDATVLYQLDNQLAYYQTTLGGATWNMIPEEVLHLQSLRYREGDVFTMWQASESWGVGIAAERYTGKFFEQGESGSGILEVPLGMRDQAVDRVVKGLKERHGGWQNAFRTLVLRDGMKYAQQGTTPRDGQVDALRTLSAEDVARWFNLPPHKLGVGDRQSYSSIEQENRDYLESTLSEPLHVIQAEVWLKLLSPAERRAKSHDCKHDTSELITGDTQTQVDTGVKATAGGLITTNEWRKKQNMAPIEGGDVLRVPLNTGPATGESEEPEETEPEEPEENGEASRKLTKQMFWSYVKPFFSRIRTESRRKSVDQFKTWSTTQCGNAARDLRERFQPLNDLDLPIPPEFEPESLISSLNRCFADSITATRTNPDLFADTLAERLQQYEESIA